MTVAAYDEIGRDYAQLRRPDPRIAAAIRRALGDVRSVINVGAGTGSYEPSDCQVLAIEPSDVMIDQRPPGAAPCRKGMAEALPVADASFDAAMAILTIHHWQDWRAGLAELRRVARQRIVLLTCEPRLDDFWLARDYLPALTALDDQIMPPLADLQAELGPASIVPIPIPHDCTDGFLCAYWRRPEAYLDPARRAGISSFARIGDPGPALARLADDLATGRWHAANADILNRESMDFGYRLLVW